MDFSNLSSEITTGGQSNATYKVEGRDDGNGYFSPHGQNSTVGVIVIQEWWGLNKSICTTTDTFAQQGFLAISPDIYRGKCAKDHEEAGHLMSGLDWKGAVADISGAVSFLREKGAKKVAVVGFCMGGALALASATQDPKIDAVVPFYGIPDLKQWPIQNVKAPIFGNFGETDALKGFSTPEDAKNFEEIAKSHGVQVQIKIWPGVGHAFMNQDSKAFNKEVASLALAEVVTFIKSIESA